jgi:hypothetical protein
VAATEFADVSFDALVGAGEAALAQRQRSCEKLL